MKLKGWVCLSPSYRPTNRTTERKNVQNTVIFAYFTDWFVPNSCMSPKQIMCK